MSGRHGSTRAAHSVCVAQAILGDKQEQQAVERAEQLPFEIVAPKSAGLLETLAEVRISTMAEETGAKMVQRANGVLAQTELGANTILFRRLGPDFNDPERRRRRNGGVLVAATGNIEARAMANEPEQEKIRIASLSRDQEREAASFSVSPVARP